MDAEKDKELLCFLCGNVHYAVEFQDIEEICYNVILYSVPCLPEYFCGVFYYKGGVIPVLKIDCSFASPESGEFTSVMVVKSGNCLFGIRMLHIPWICRPSEEITSKDVISGFVPPRWKVKNVYKMEKDLLFLLDVGGSAGGLIAYPE